MSLQTSHESKGLHIIAKGYLQRISGAEQPVIGPIPLEYIGASPKLDIKQVLDPRPDRRGQTLFGVTDPKPSVGKLISLACPPKLAAMALMGRESALAIAGGTVAGEAHLYVADYGVQLAQRNVSQVVVTTGTRAALATGTAGAKTGITWTAVAPGVGGNAITVALIDPATASHALTVAVVGTAITVTMATDGTSAKTTTAAEAIAAAAASPAVAALVTPTLTSGAGNDGSGVLSAVALTALTGGSASGTVCTPGTDYEVLDAHEGLIRPLVGGIMGTSGTCFVSYTHGAITGTALDFGTDTVVRARVWMLGYNDTDPNQESVRWECADALLVLNSEINLVGADPVKLEFTLTPLTPVGRTSPIELSYPAFN